MGRTSHKRAANTAYELETAHNLSNPSKMNKKRKTITSSSTTKNTSLTTTTSIIKPKFNKKEHSEVLNSNSNLRPKSGLIDDIFQQKKTKKMEFAIKAKKSKEIVNERQQQKMLVGDRTDVKNLQANVWVDDGLGGKFNNDGWTGRRDEGGLKIFKAHLFNNKDFGNTRDCPFDCSCCYI